MSQRVFPPTFSNYDRPLAKAPGLTYLVLGSPLQRLPGLSAQPASELLLSGPPIGIYRIPGALPRVVMTEATPSDQARPLNAAPACPSTDARPSAGDPTALTETTAGVSKIQSSVPGKLDVVTKSISAERLLVHNIYYPGWVAELDGKPTPIHRTNQLFLAVDVPAGSHHVTFRYAPFALGNLLTAFKSVVGRTTQR